MRIINLKAENFKRLVAIEITPDGELVDIVGRNGQGKTSILDSIWALFAGKGAIPNMPIRKGANEARIEGVIGTGEKIDLVVRRTFKRDGEHNYTTALTVEAADGARYAQPQKLLDGLLGALSFDPLAFARMSAKEQLEELRKLVPEFNFAAADGANARDYEQRTDVNRKAKQLKAQLDTMVVPGDPRVTRVDESALVAELEAVGEKKAEIERESTRRTNMLRGAKDHRGQAAQDRQEAQELRDRIVELEEEIDGLKEKITHRETRATEHDSIADKTIAEAEALPPLEEAPSTAAIKARIDAARKTNADVTERERVLARAKELREEIAQTVSQSEQLTANIEQRDEDKATAIAAAKLPIEGLGLGDHGVFFNGIPLDQASDAERLCVSVAIAAAMNPKLRVVRIRDGSLLDVDAVKALATFAKDRDLQIWREVVDDGNKTGIIIEDGRVKASTETEAAA